MKNKTHLTKRWITTTFCLLIVLYFLICLVLIGEINVLHQQWLIGFHGTLWTGKITSKNAQWIINTFGKYVKNIEDEVQNNMDKYVRILSNQMILNPYIFFIICPPILLAFLIPICLKKFQIMNIDVLPFSITTAIAFFSLIICGLIPHWKNDNSDNIWLWIIKFLIVIAIILIVYFPTTYFVNKILSNTNYDHKIIEEYNQIDMQSKSYKDSLTTLKDQYDKKDKIEYIETE